MAGCHGAGKTGEVRGHDFFRGVEFKWTVTAGPGNSDNDRRSGNVPVRNECYGWRS